MHYLWATPIPIRQAETMCNAWLRGYPIQHHILDNECSADLKAAFSKYNIDYQLAPPAEHRVNASECAILTFKNQLIATFCTVNSQFSMSKWDQLIHMQWSRWICFIPLDFMHHCWPMNHSLETMTTITCHWYHQAPEWLLTLHPTNSEGEHSLCSCPTVIHPTKITHAQLCSGWPEICWQYLQSL